MPRSAPWLKTTERLLAYRDEAAGFLERAAQQFGASSPSHLPLVARLWLAAEEADPLVHRLLGDVNAGLLKGRGKLDVSRGAYLLQATPSPPPRSLPETPAVDWQAFGFPGSPFLRANAAPLANVAASPPDAQDDLVYNCTWSLAWPRNHGVTIDLGIAAQEGEFVLRVHTERADHEQRLAYPTTEAALQDALAAAYIAETLADESPAPAPTAAAGSTTAKRRAAPTRSRARPKPSAKKSER
jgi:hypothetical protein